jgi:hypothetical protein
MLGRLCTVYGLTLSRLMIDAEALTPSVIRASEQTVWKDPKAGYKRRAVSPPSPQLKGEVVEVVLSPGTLVEYDAPPVPGLEHHLWMLEGLLYLDIDGNSFKLRSGDCVRFLWSGKARFECRGHHHTRYVIALVHP